MKFYFSAILLLVSFLGNAQRLHADLYAGLANYEGDIKSKPGPSVGLGLSYDLTSKLIVRGAATFARLQGNDKNSDAGKGLQLRNLNFKTNILEGQLLLEYNLFDLEDRSITPYVFGGGAVYYFNPFTNDAAGNKVFLQQLTTEGQGLPQYPDRKPYKLVQFAIPFGGGFKMALSDKIQFGLELGLRKLFTDYIDDVSTFYADSSILSAARGPKAVELAYRGDEIPGGPTYPLVGSERGNPKVDDWFYTGGIRIRYLLGSGNGNGGGRKNKTGCPTNIY
ncbi:MAG: DUF6089 family protein [Ferruginibacter sp.]